MFTIQLTIRIIFVVYLLVVLLVILKKRDFFYKKSSLLFFFLLFLYQMSWILQGLDITDEGFNLAKSWFMLHGMWKENLDAIAGSSLFGGLWMSIVAKPSILWARIGAAILISSNFLFILKILNFYFDKIKNFVFLFVAAIYTTSPSLCCTTINYNNFPVFLVIISIFLLFNLSEKNKKIISFFVAIFLIFAVFSRLMFVPFLLIPLFFSIFSKKYNCFFSQPNILLYTIGFLVGLALILILLISTNSLNDYIANIKTNFGSSGTSHADKTHSLNYLTNLYLNDLWSIIKKTVLAIAFATFVAFFENTKLKKKLKFTICAFATILLICIIEYFTKHNVHWWKHFIIAIVLANSIVFLLTQKQNYIPKFLLFIGFYLILFSFVGSNNSVLVAIYSGSSALAFVGSMLFVQQSQLSIKKLKFSFKIWVYISLLSILIFILLHKNNDVYRDKQRNFLNCTFKSSVLWAISSSKDRVECVDSLLNYFKTTNLENKTILSVNSNPMIYYLLNKPYYLDNPWFITKEEFEKKTKNVPLPHIIIFATKNPRNPNWPQNSEICIPFDQQNYDYFKKLVESNHYKSTFKNSMFEVFEEN